MSADPIDPTPEQGAHDELAPGAPVPVPDDGAFTPAESEAPASVYANLREVQEYMGHASVTTTELYAHFVPRLDAAARGARPASQRC
jgi:hypothetical protein